MEKKFTPGPWIQDDDFIYHLNSNGHNSFGFKVGFSCVCSDCKELPIPDVKATASLIAAAPELLEALEYLVDALPSNRDWLNPVTEMFAKKAIKKAYGEPE